MRWLQGLVVVSFFFRLQVYSQSVLFLRGNKVLLLVQEIGWRLFGFFRSIFRFLRLRVGIFQVTFLGIVIVELVLFGINRGLLEQISQQSAIELGIWFGEGFRFILTVLALFFVGKDFGFFFVRIYGFGYFLLFFVRFFRGIRFFSRRSSRQLFRFVRK